MKILAFALLALLVGCQPEVQHKPYPDNKEALSNDYIVVDWKCLGHDCQIFVTSFMYKGHEYLVTARNGSYSYNAQTIHAESCPCKKAK